MINDSIKSRYDEVSGKINLACQKAGRKREDVTLVVVTKGHAAEKIIEAIKAGAENLGENYPEETLLKINEIKGNGNPTWHMIGHLQSRKIKMMYPTFSLIQSVDSIELAKKLNTFYAEKEEICKILIEVNVAGEESKFGFMADSLTRRDELLRIFENLLLLKNISIKGLMTMPPYAIQETQNALCYDLCRDILHKIKTHFNLLEFTDLSMGTSADYETAIKYGATYVRVGEAIMGKRIYN